MAPSRKYNLSQKMYADGDIYLGDHLTRSWTRDERRGSRQPASPVLSEPEKPPSTANSMYQMKHGHASLSRTRSSLREPRGSRKNWVSKAALQNVSQDELHEWKQSFDKLLQSPVGSKLFRVFLESEIAEENLLFWEAVEELRQIKKEKRVRKLIQNIFDDFISVYSPREINIDYKMREDIVEQLNNSTTPDPDVFREAQMQIYHLMHRDSYPRFLATAQTAHQIEDFRHSMKGSKRQHQECEARRKVNTKSRILCCYGNDNDDEETQERFVTMEEQQHIIEESPKAQSPANGQSVTDMQKHKQTDNNVTTKSSDAVQSKPVTHVGEIMTPSNNTVTSKKNETVHADVMPHNVADDTPHKISDSETETSSKRGVSCSSHCEEEVINDIITTIEKSESDVAKDDDVIRDIVVDPAVDNNNVTSGDVKQDMLIDVTEVAIPNIPTA